MREDSPLWKSSMLPLGITNVSNLPPLGGALAWDGAAAAGDASAAVVIDDLI